MSDALRGDLSDRKRFGKSDHAEHSHAISQYSKISNEKHSHADHDRLEHNHTDHSHAGHRHNHAAGMAKRTLRLAFFLTVLILVVELTGGLLAHSLALISDAGHAITDIFALGLAWFATAQAERPANSSKTFGYHRVGILAALINAASLVVIAGAILWEAIQRFQHPEPVQPLFMFAAAAIGIVLNLFIGFGLRKDGSNLNVRAASLHVFGDVGASVAVIVGGLIILLTGWTVVDPLLSVGVALLIAVGSWHVLRETTSILLESVPQGVTLTNVVRDMCEIDGVKEVHDLHVWSITGDMSALSCHVLIENLPPSDSATILTSLNNLLSSKYRITHSTIQFECSDYNNDCCSAKGLYCQLNTSDMHVGGDNHAHHEHELQTTSANLPGQVRFDVK